MPDTAAVPPQPPPDVTPRDVASMVGSVLPGSVVALRGADFDQEDLGDLVTELARVSGHHQFVVVNLPRDARLDVVHDPQAVANLLGLTRPEPVHLDATPAPPCPQCGYCCAPLPAIEVTVAPDLRTWPGMELRLDQHHSTVPPPERAAWLLRNVRQRGDEYGDVANATADELRDALVLAAAALNAAQAPDVPPEASTVAFLAAGAVAPDAPDVAQAYLDAHKGMPHAALLVGDSTTCPCGEATTAPIHQGTFRAPAVPDLVERLDASLAAARDYLATHPPEPERTYLDVLAEADDHADDPWWGTPGRSDVD